MITADGKKLGARGRGHDEQCTVEKIQGHVGGVMKNSALLKKIRYVGGDMMSSRMFKKKTLGTWVGS